MVLDGIAVAPIELTLPEGVAVDLLVAIASSRA